MLHTAEIEGVMGIARNLQLMPDAMCFAFKTKLAISSLPTVYHTVPGYVSHVVTRKEKKKLKTAP